MNKKLRTESEVEEMVRDFYKNRQSHKFDIEDLIHQIRKDDLKYWEEKIHQIVDDYIKWNWNASLGYDKDKEVYEHALEELSWLAKPFNITAGELLDKIK